jgi:hypothetical protein
LSDAHLLFHSTHHALWAEKVLLDAGFTAKLVSVPRELSSDCGYCVRVDAAAVGAVQEVLGVEGVEVDRVVGG